MDAPMINNAAAQRLFAVERDLNINILIAIGRSGNVGFAKIANQDGLKTVDQDRLRVQLAQLEKWGFVQQHKSLVAEGRYYASLILRSVLTVLSSFGSILGSKPPSQDKSWESFVKDDVVYSLTVLGNDKLDKHNSAHNWALQPRLMLGFLLI